MKAYQISSAEGPEHLKLIDLPPAELGPRDVLVKMRACSLNYRDLLVAAGGYPRNDKCPVVPLSDGAGEVLACGAEVTAFKVGDRVAGTFVQDWIDGNPDDRILHSCLGGGIDGVLCEEMCFPEHGLVKIPPHLSFEEAACLPCAGVTAWHALVELGKLSASDTILLLGTGGVSMFGLQFAKMFGARVIITSSSDQKLEIARQHGADELINYKKIEDWPARVRELTEGRGVDHVLDVGGPGTLEKSCASTRPGGIVSIIGVLTGVEGQISPLAAIFDLIRLNGIYVGSRAMFERMNKAISHNHLNPIIGERFAFDDALSAYRALQGANHTGKIVINF